ncbi:DNA double-strand break repair nuclease NurA [bacterium]|nr:DNA double-strand break repair nuclease NurA [bacterium]
MPINLIDIRKRLADYAQKAETYQVGQNVRQRDLVELAYEYAAKTDELRSRVMAANSRWRCALPVDEPVDTVVPMPALPEQVTVLAADGSQINPSRHTRVPLGMINIGLVKMVRGSGERTQVITESELLDFDEVYLPGGGMISEGRVALKRDLRERESLIRLAGEWQPPAVAMVDGPLELIREVQAVVDFQKVMRDYQDILRLFEDSGLMLLGYIDKPQSDLIGRMLELVAIPEGATFDARSRQFANVRDRDWLREQLQNPGERSAVFAIHSETTRELPADLAFHFFYLNVGWPGEPHLARVEVPGFVAQNPEWIGLIQAVLTDQAHALAARPYPYLLHRSHEEAVISLAEHQRMEDMIITAFQERGMTVGQGSNKQFLKDSGTKKTRYTG